jgi:hypothetical protein
MAITHQTLSTSATTVYTSSGNTAVTAMFFMNNNASARTLDLYVVPNGGTAGTTNQIVKSLSIDPADTYVVNIEKIILANGDFIAATSSADATSIFATISYVSI